MQQRLHAAILCVACALPVANAAAQNGVREQLWIDYNASWGVTDRVEIFGDLGARTDLESSTDWKLLVLRPGLLYTPGGRLRLAGGLASFNTFSDTRLDQTELRIWQGVGTIWPRTIRLDHYIRTEERIYFDADTWDASWSVRTRYSVQLPIDLETWHRGRYLRLYLCAEGFLTLGSEPRERHRQMRTILGIEHARSRTLRFRFDTMLELAHRYQTADDWTALCLRLRIYHAPR